MHFVEKEPGQKRVAFDQKLKSNQLDKLNISIQKTKLKRNLKKGIF